MNSHPYRLLSARSLVAVWALLFSAGVMAENTSGDRQLEEQVFFEEKCGNCHPSERIFLIKMSPELRKHVVLRMRERVEPGAAWLSDEEINRILAYVEERSSTGESVQPKAAENAKELFRERCKGCHELDRIYMQVKTERENPQAWMHVVTRMQAKAPDWISEEEAREIVDYLRERTASTTPPASTK
jgi:mono/diheme cytochrome c family protein